MQDDVITFKLVHETTPDTMTMPTCKKKNAPLKKKNDFPFVVSLQGGGAGWENFAVPLFFAAIMRGFLILLKSQLLGRADIVAFLRFLHDFLKTFHLIFPEVRVTSHAFFRCTRNSHKFFGQSRSNFYETEI